MHNVHEAEPTVFETRWAMSYLRGPLTRDHIRRLMAPIRDARGPQPTAPEAVRPATGASKIGPDAPAPPSARALPARPVLPPDVPQFVVPAGPAGERHYVPQLYAAGRIHFADPKLNVDETRDVYVSVPITDEAVPVDWASAETATYSPADLEREADHPAYFEPLPAAATKATSYEKWSRDFKRWLVQTKQLELLRSDRFGLTSRPLESERDFRIRLQTAAREARDAATDKLRQKYAVKVASLQERIRRAEQVVQREQEQVSQQKTQTAISFGATVLSALFGRKTVSASTLGKATTAARGVGRSMKEQQDVDRARQNVETFQSQLADLEAQIAAETKVLTDTFDPLSEELRTLSLRPKTSQVTVQVVALVWTPR